MDMEKPKGFLENLFAFYSQYLREHGTEPFSEGKVNAVLMDFFVAGTPTPSYPFQDLKVMRHTNMIQFRYVNHLIMVYSQ